MSGKILKLTGFALAMGLLLSQQVFAAVTTAPSVNDITVTNSITGVIDTIEVSNVVTTNVVKVYNAATNGTVIGYTVATGTTATVFVNQLGVAAGSVYVTKQSGADTESASVAKAFSAEAVDTTLAGSAITVTNNCTGAFDKIVVDGAVGDVVKAYTAAAGGTPIAVAKVLTGDTKATMYVSQLGVLAGNVYVSSSSTGKNERARTEKAFDAEPVSTALELSQITVTNKIEGAADTIALTGLTIGDIVSVYAAAKGGTALGTVTADATSETISIDQLGAKAGKAYIAVKTPNKNESARTAAAYTSEISDAPKAADITITNNFAGINDTVEVKGLVEGDVVKVYSDAALQTEKGTATVGAGKDTAVISFAQAGTAKGNLYVTLTKTGKLISKATTKAFIAEVTVAPLTAVAPVAGYIKVTNNYVGTDDEIAFTNLTEADIIKVYTSATGTDVFATATVATGAENTTKITKAQIGIPTGTLYFTRTTASKTESPRTAKTYASEPITTALTASQVTITNKKDGTADTIVITGLAEGDVVSYYAVAKAGTATSATVAAQANSATISVAQMGAVAGKAYITVKSTTKQESARIAVPYLSETSDAPAAANIIVTNNLVGTNDTAVIKGLVEGDKVAVYADAITTTKLKSATIGSGETSVTFDMGQLGLIKGNIYVTVEKVGRFESKRTTKAYSAEPALSSIAVTTPATKLIYTVGDLLDISGLVVTGTYSNTTSKEVTVIAGNVTGFSSASAVASQTLTITIGGKTTTYVVEIKAAATLSSIAVTTPATKLTYNVGETLDITGLVVTGTYSDATTKAEAVVLGNVTGFNSTVAADDQVLTVTVGGRTTTFTVDIQ
ncbi:MAG: bacterial Ig-like domain-containing protein [Hyphomonadaceae bacterium]|nr:bacterial Ig-like domain-containing protein [Clostridia bacterium]